MANNEPRLAHSAQLQTPDFQLPGMGSWTHHCQYPGLSHPSQIAEIVGKQTVAQWAAKYEPVKIAVS